MSRSFTWQPTPQPIPEGSFTFGIASALADTYDLEVNELDGWRLDGDCLRVLIGMRNMTSNNDSKAEFDELIKGIERYGSVTITIEP